ncbi:aldehyde dehydrogenase family protein [Streptomyces sp. DSM 41972]|uniref:Aldehyde dehydrogenase family protein n=1 Tax=Streptomyces althioticus subsp. attaecolombicae TaxID=3075534 RepID=A0ABU3I5G9_9ACTN|nr:aldehyde dehydrogenase family protein [Streptomyces sp. DSM 41972]SCD88542.1 benzaldehyde dehydrogenase (NAD+) [Streptomyces sp. di50b]SCE11085.1 benzaldehyde dehydrogenase (NAD+) [Streptomyces sp. di188]
MNTSAPSGAFLPGAGTEAPETTEAEVRAAAAEAATAQPGWAARAPGERAAVLRRALALLAAPPPDLTDLFARESGAVRPKAEMELGAAMGELAFAAGLAGQAAAPAALDSTVEGRTARAERVPLGVVGVITPWNMPLMLALRSVAPALALGNAVLLKPDPHTPVLGGRFVAWLFRRAGLPDGLLHVLPGGAATGTAVVEAPQVAMVSFTGSTEAGRSVARTAGGLLKKVSLELGGNNAFVVLADADADAAASAGAFGSFVHSGQLCIAVGRHLVHRSVAERYTAALAKKAEALTAGDPADPATRIGPLIDERQLAKVRAIVADTVAAGARLVCGGTAEGRVHRPTVLDGVRPGMRAFDEEIFGPVAPVTVFEDVDEAVALADATEYGLAAAVYGGDPETARSVAARLRAGMVHVGDQTVVSEPQLPFGGVGSSGNGGRFGGPAAVEAFTQWRLTTESTPPRRHPF